MNLRVYLLIVLSLTLTFGCKRTRVPKLNPTLVNYQNFHTTTHLSFQDDNLELSQNVFRLTIVDSVLLAADLSGNENLKIIGLNSKKVLKSIIRRGNNANETINITDFSFTDKDKIIWTYDLTLKKLQKIDVTKALQQSTYTPEYEFFVNKDLLGITSPIWIQDKKFASLSLALDDCRYLYFNEQSETIKKIGEMPEPNANWPTQSENAKMGILGMSYSALLRKHPLENKFAVLYENTDRIDFYRDDKLMKIISGPDHFNVIKKFNQQGTGAYVPNNIETTKYAFFDAYVTNSYIYALYSGTKKSKANQILVFDWDGNPVKRYTLDKNLTYFAFKAEKNEFSIFGFNNGRLIHTNIKESLK